MQLNKMGCVGALLLHLALRPDAAAHSSSGASEEGAVLQELLAEALENNPGLKAAGELVAQARSRAIRAGTLPDPMVSLGYQNDGWSPTLGSEMMTFVRVGWSQDLPYPGKRDLRTDLVVREVDDLTARSNRIRLDVVSSVKRAYFGLLLARGLLELLGDEDAAWMLTEEAVVASYRVGEGSQPDVIRAQVERARIEVRRAELEAEAHIRVAELNGLLGRNAGRPLETTESLTLRPMSQSLFEILEETRQQSPELARARIASDRSDLEISLADKEGRPDFRLGAAYMNRGGLPSMWEVELGINLPVYRDRVDQSRAEARAGRRQAEHDLETIELVLRSRTEQRYSALKSFQRIAELYQAGLLPLDRVGVEAALAGYRTGKIPFVAVLEAVNRLYADQIAYLRTLAAHEQTLADMKAAKLDSDDMAF